MELSKNAIYAVMTVIDIATYSAIEKVDIESIANRQKIPLLALAQTLSLLQKESIITGSSSEGYKLQNDANQISLFQVIKASEERIKMTRCKECRESGCADAVLRCNSHFIWRGLSEVIENYFSNLTVAQAIENHVNNSALK